MCELLYNVNNDLCSRVLTRRARKLASQYFLTYQEQIPVDQLVQKVANVMQEFTQSGYVKALIFCQRLFLNVCICITLHCPHFVRPKIILLL